MNEKGKNKLKNARKFQDESDERKIPRIKRIMCKVKRKSKKIIKYARENGKRGNYGKLEENQNYVRKRKKMQKAKLSFCVKSRNRCKNSRRKMQENQKK